MGVREDRCFNTFGVGKFTILPCFLLLKVFE